MPVVQVTIMPVRSLAMRDQMIFLQAESHHQPNPALLTIIAARQKILRHCYLYKEIAICQVSLFSASKEPLKIFPI